MASISAPMMATISTIGTAISAATAVFSLISTLTAEQPKIPDIDYAGHNAQVDLANEESERQKRLIAQETQRLQGEADTQKQFLLTSENNGIRESQNAVLRAEQNQNSAARQDQLRLLELEGATIEKALRESAQKGIASQKRQETNKKLAMVTGLRGRRSLLTSNALGYDQQGIGL